MKIFEFSFLRFVIDNDKIFLFDEINNNLLNADQKWILEHTSFICDIQISGNPTTIHAGDRHICSSESETLKYINHEIIKQNDSLLLKIKQRNSQIEVISFYEEYQKVIRCWTQVKNISTNELSLEYVSSFCKYDLTSFNNYDHISFFLPHNSWFLECQWKKFSLSSLGIVSPNMIKTFKKFCISNTGNWSTKNYLPMGLIKDQDKYFLFQIEANGSWSYELGDYCKTTSLHLSGPTLQENGWSKILLPNEIFESVKVAITKDNSLQNIFDNITLYRRKISTSLDSELPIIFNEYMFASWNDPSKETALALAPIAKKLGADYFVIDCGWHDEEKNPFYHVGKWKESKTKYPDGLINTLNYLRSLDLKVGLWLELEVVGYLGDAKNLYTDDCFFQRDNKPLIISNRYQLDLRNEKVFNHLLSIIDELMEKYHLDYIKFDYNIEPGVGTSLNSSSLGDGLLQYNRKYHYFIDCIKKKYPSLVIESCASGGNRLDYYSLNNVNLCSTSDQTDYAIYPYIIANILTAVLPEQAGIWSYPKSELMDKVDDECIVMNMVNSFIGRVHLASKLYLLPQNQQDLIKEALDLYKKASLLHKDSLPYFPIGLAQYNDNYLAFGYKNNKKGYLCVYNMHDNKEITFTLNNIKTLKLVYPSTLKTDFKFINNNFTWKVDSSLQARIFYFEEE